MSVLFPVYGEQPWKMIDSLEDDPGRRSLWNAIADVIDLICEHPDSAAARIEQVRLFVAGITIWQVPVRVSGEDDDWVVMWQRQDEEAVISYIGPRPR